MDSVQRRLGGLALGVEADATDLEVGNGRPLDARSVALVQLGALLAMDGPAVSINRATQDALARGVGESEILEAITCLVPILGTARVAAVAPKLAIALGYDLDEAFHR